MRALLMLLLLTVLFTCLVSGMVLTIMVVCSSVGVSITLNTTAIVALYILSTIICIVLLYCLAKVVNSK